MKCAKCGYEGSRAVFRYGGLVEGGFRRSYRRCPKCGAFTECDEFAEDEKEGSGGAWGLKALGKKSGKEVKEDA